MRIIFIFFISVMLTNNSLSKDLFETKENKFNFF